MKSASIRSHLRQHSIRGRRATTINHASASAISPVDTYDKVRVDLAMSLLGQSRDADLNCVYRGRGAQTWDHLSPLVKNGKLSGHGHTSGNLVPCCRDCNSQKGSKDWRDWVAHAGVSPQRIKRLEGYIVEFQERRRSYEDLRRICPQLMDAYDQTLAEILTQMSKADEIATRIVTVASREE